MHEHPIWSILKERGLDMAWLAWNTTYTESYVRGVKNGSIKPSRRFKTLCSVALQKPGAELFLSDECQSDGQTTDNEIVEIA